MAKLYRISPKDKKSIEHQLDIQETLSDGTTRFFDAVFYYRWGQGFRPELAPPTPAELESLQVECNPELGWDPEFDDLYSVHINFSNDYQAEEKEEILKFCNGEFEDAFGRSGESWILEGERNLKIVGEKIIIHGPFSIDLVDEDQYNVVLQKFL